MTEEKSVPKALSFNAIKDIPETIKHQIIKGSLQEIVQKFFDKIPQEEKDKIYGEAIWNSSKKVPKDIEQHVYTEEAKAVFSEIVKQVISQIPENVAEQASQQIIQQAIQQVGPSIHNLELIPYLQAQMLKNPKNVGTENPTKSDKENSTIEWVNSPPEGGIFTKLAGFREPFRGFPPVEFVFALDGVKKITKALLQSIQAIPKWKLILIAPLIYPSLNRIFNKTLYGLYAALRAYELKPDKYSAPVREVLKAFDETIKDERKEMKITLERLKMTIALLLEFDNAYRFRFQDVFGEFDPYYEKGITKEVMRLFDLMIERENATLKKQEWRLFKMVVGILLRFNKETRRLTAKILSNFNEQAVWLSKEDICFCEGRTDFSFGFMKKQGYISGKNLEYLLKAIFPQVGEIQEIKNNVANLKKWAESLTIVPEQALKEEFKKS